MFEVRWAEKEPRKEKVSQWPLTNVLAIALHQEYCT